MFVFFKKIVWLHNEMKINKMFTVAIYKVSKKHRSIDETGMTNHASQNTFNNDVDDKDHRN